MKITAVIPVRAGSQRVPNKNLRSFAGTNLLQLKIDVLKKAQSIDEIVVNTDSNEALELAKKNKISYHEREPYFASSACTGADFFQHLGHTTNCDYFIYAPVTAPFITEQLYDRCVENLISQNKHDSIATVNLLKHHMWMDGKPLNYELKKHPNSQDLPDIFALNFGVCVIKRNLLIELKNVVGRNPMFVELSEIEGVDIDTPLDFYIAEQLYYKLIIKNEPLLS